MRRIGTNMTAEPARLRQRAQWYREFAKLGNSHEREWRFQIADYFDRLAEQAEKDGEPLQDKSR